MTPGLRFNFSAAKRNVAKNIRSPGRNGARNAPTRISRVSSSLQITAIDWTKITISKKAGIAGLAGLAGLVLIVNSIQLFLLE